MPSILPKGTRRRRWGFVLRTPPSTKDSPQGHPPDGGLSPVLRTIGTFAGSKPFCDCLSQRSRDGSRGTAANNPDNPSPSPESLSCGIDRNRGSAATSPVCSRLSVPSGRQPWSSIAGLFSALGGEE